jgi:hypothetical protein
MKTEPGKFYGLIGEIRMAMLSTRRPHGPSRAERHGQPETCRRRRPVVRDGRWHRQLRNIAHDPHVNLA